MIVRIEDYRADEPAPLQEYADEALEGLQVNGNVVLARKFALRREHAEASPDLPDQFDDFNAKEFIERAYQLASQI